MTEVQRVFQLDPEPPEAEDINDYIKSAVAADAPRYFTFFLHHYEKRLNNRVYRFLIREGIDRYEPECFVDYKLSCALAVLEDLPKYDSSKGADFLTFAHHDIGNALMEHRMREEAGSFENVATKFEGSSASGAERAYNKTVNKLTTHLVEMGVLGVVELK